MWLNRASKARIQVPTGFSARDHAVVGEPFFVIFCV